MTGLKIPRFAVRLLEWRFTSDEAEAIVGDLSEEFDQRAEAHGVRSARRWFWRQALTSMTARRGSVSAGGARRNGLSGISHELRFALRSLWRAPGFAVAAVATLSLGIGAATAVGTAATRTLLRPLPFPEGRRLVVLGDDNDGQMRNVGFETVVDWRARLRSLDELAMIRSWQPTLTTDSGAVRLDGIRVSWNFFRTLGVRPALGRDFDASDDTPASRFVVMLSDGLWRQRFSASPAIVGTQVDFNGTKYTVAGVMPASFEPLVSERFYRRAELWSPIGYVAGGDSSCRSCRHLHAIGRLGRGVTVASARAELQTVQAAISLEHPGEYSDAPPHLEPLQDVITDAMRRPFQLLMGAVAFVLLVACANIAGLLVARASDRVPEMALRAALGASRGRLVRQLLVESAVLAGLAAGIGVFIARGALVYLAAHAPVTIPRLSGAAGDPWLFGIAALASIVALMACAVLPALLSSRTGLESTLRESRQTATRGALRVREWLMAVELAAALLVVTLGGLMSHTVAHMMSVDPGFRSEGVLTAGLSLVGQRWAEDADVRQFQAELLRRVQALPGVTSAALSGQVPLGGSYDTRGYFVVGRPVPPEADRPSAEHYSVTPGYFKLMGITLKEGRLLTDADRFGSEPVIVIGETTAREEFPGRSPIGQRLQFGSAERPRLATIVGVVNDVRHYSLATTPNQQFYATQEQLTDSYLVLLVRTDQPAATTAAIRREIAAIAPDVPVYNIEPLDALVAKSIGTRSFLMLLLTGLGAITLILAGIGLYGVVSQAVAARRRELGIRVALGATRASVLSLIARRGGTVCLGGIALGLAATAAGGRLIQTQLFETAPFDPAVIGAAVFLLLLVAFAAHVVPIRRALNADPRDTLRAD